MRVLFIMDPLEQLYPEWDTSLCLLRELRQRGHKIWAADSPDIFASGRNVFANAASISPRPVFSGQKLMGNLKGAEKHYQLLRPKRLALTQFDIVLIRKDPPFDVNYLYLTYLLELVAGKVPVINHPRGIRSANEKLAILHFPRWIPETLVSSSAAEILRFQNRLKAPLVLKPLHLMGGKGIVRIGYKSSKSKSVIERMTDRGKTFILAQRMIAGKGIRGDKRILVLNGEILAVFEKRPPKGDFRANLSLGGTAHPAQLSLKEKQIVRDMKPYFLKEGLLFVGLDVLSNHLIEVNVTSPSGLVEAINLYPRLGLAKAWADFLEGLARP